MQRALLEVLVLVARVRPARRVDPPLPRHVRRRVDEPRHAARARRWPRWPARRCSWARRAACSSRRRRSRSSRATSGSASDVGVAVGVTALFGLGGLLALSPAAPPALARAAVRRPARRDGAATSPPRARSRSASAWRWPPARGRSRSPPSSALPPASLGARPGRWELGAARAARRDHRRGRPGAREPAARRADRRAGRRRAADRAAAARRAAHRDGAGRARRRGGLARLPSTSTSPPGASIALCAVVPAFAAQMLPPRRPAAA